MTKKHQIGKRIFYFSVLLVQEKVIKVIKQTGGRFFSAATCETSF